MDDLLQKIKYHIVMIFVFILGAVFTLIGPFFKQMVMGVSCIGVGIFMMGAAFWMKRHENI